MDREKVNLTPEEKQILKYLSILGTPSFYRPKLWLLSSGAKQDIQSNPNYYSNLLQLSKEIPNKYEIQIIKDIPRTNEEILKKNPTFSEMMKNILLCYSIRNSSIGYCQGFNFIVLRLLQVLQNEVIIFFILL